MSDLNEHTITDAVLDRLAHTPDPRMRAVVESLVRHLHGFIRDIEPTFAEWQTAIDFLTRTGHMSDDKRQEFILLSDTLGASMLVDAINHRMPAGATETTVLGPFFVEDRPELPNGADLSPGRDGERLFVRGTVSSAGGGRIAGAQIDLWHSDSDGYYDVQRHDLDAPSGRGRIHSDADGRFWFWTTQPTPYPVPHDGPVGELLRATQRHPYRPAHLHFMIAAPGHETLVTHLFVEGDAYLDSDAVFGVKDSLVVPFKYEHPGTAPDGTPMPARWRSLTYDFGLKPLAGGSAEHRA